MLNAQTEEGLGYPRSHSPEVIIVGMKPSGRDSFEYTRPYTPPLYTPEQGLFLSPNVQHIVGTFEVFVGGRRKEGRVKERRKGEREYLNYKVS